MNAAERPAIAEAVERMSWSREASPRGSRVWLLQERDDRLDQARRGA